MTDAALVERVARAICAESPGCKIGNRVPDDRLTLTGDPLWMAFQQPARAAIAAFLREIGSTCRSADEAALFDALADEVERAAKTEEHSHE